MSRIERIDQLLLQIQHETANAFDEYWRLLDKCNDLEKENAKLSTQLADVTESMGRVEERCAKLRELVLEVWRSCPVDGDDCKKCPHYIAESDEVWCDIPIRMSELGIEVG